MCLMPSVLAVVLTAILAGVAAEQAEAQAERLLTVATPYEPTHLDPSESMDVQHDVNYHILRKLYAFNPPDMTPRPDLVAAEKVSADGLVWTLELRRNVVFHDGTPLNAEAVKYTIDRMKDPKRAAPMAVLFAPIDSVRVVNDHTVELRTKEPFASLRNNLAHPNTGILSPTADRALGSQFGRKPVSAGPYMVSEWISGDRIVLKRFGRFVGPVPYYDTIVFRVVPDAQTRMVMVERGEVDVALRMHVTQLGVAERNRDLQVVRLDGTRLIYLFFNLDKAPVSDPRVRRAFNLAVDRDALMKRVLLGAGAPARSVMEDILSFSTPVGSLEYKPDVARALLQEAGVAGQTIRIVSSDGNWEFDRQSSEAVAGFLRAVGMKVELDVIKDYGVYVETLRKREHHLGFVAWAGATGDPDHYLRRQLWGSNAGKPWNFSGYKNARVDELIALGARTFDLDQRAKIYGELQRVVWNDQPWLILYRLTSFSFARASLEGITPVLTSEALVYVGTRPKAR